MGRPWHSLCCGRNRTVEDHHPKTSGRRNTHGKRSQCDLRQETALERANRANTSDSTEQTTFGAVAAAAAGCGSGRSLGRFAGIQEYCGTLLHCTPLGRPFTAESWYSLSGQTHRASTEANLLLHCKNDATLSAKYLAYKL